MEVTHKWLCAQTKCEDLFLLEQRREEGGLEAVEGTATTIAKSTRKAGATNEIFFPVKREEGGWPMYVHTTTKLAPTTQRFHISNQ